MGYPDKYVHKVEDIPNTEHFAIFRQNTIYIPGDERSRTNPGHGYPASTEYTIDYEAYLTFDKFQAQLNLETAKLGQIRIAKIIPYKVEVQTKVLVK